MQYKKYVHPFFWFITYFFIGAAGLIWLSSMSNSSVADTLLAGPAFYPVLIGVVIGLSIAFICRVLSAFYPAVKNMEKEFSSMIGQQRIVDCFILAVFSSIAEELFFRGAMQPKIGIFMTSIVFGLLHYPLNTNLKLWPVFAVVMGFVFGLEYELSKTILMPISTHFVVNFINLIRISVSYRSELHVI